MRRLLSGFFGILLFVFVCAFCINTYTLNEEPQAPPNTINDIQKPNAKTEQAYNTDLLRPYAQDEGDSLKPLIEPEPIPEPEPEPITHRLRLSVVGDIMLHSYQYNNGTQNGFDSHFEPVSPYLNAADITAGNLETVLAGLPYSDFPNFSAPDSFGYAIKNAGFNMLTTANNHSLDKREAGLYRTLVFLDELEIKHTGTYSKSEERDLILLIEHDNIRIAFLSYSFSTNGIQVPKGKDYLINLLKKELIEQDIERAKELEPDFIIVMPHMGDEYETMPRKVYKDWAEFFFECGADFVLASHPHVIQPFEIFEKQGRKRAVAYSLGNFISGQRTKPRDEGIILNIEFEKTDDDEAIISRITFIPTWVMFTNNDGKPDVKVMPIGDALADINPFNARPKDITRMKEALTNIKKMMGIETDEIKTEYLIYEYGH